MNSEYKCQTCSARGTFTDRLAAVRAKWSVGELWTAGGLKHICRCPKDAPDWFAKAVADLTKESK